MPPKQTKKQRRDAEPEFTPTLGFVVRRWSLVIPAVMLVVTLLGSFAPEQRDKIIDSVFTAVENQNTTTRTY